MTPQLATIIYIVGIIAIFFLDRDKTVRTSRALWIPVMWLMINGSRAVSLWLQSGPTVGDQYADGSPIDAAVFGALSMGGLVVLVSRRDQVEKFLRGNAPILLFLAYCALSTLWSDYSFVSFKRWIKSVGDIVMILVVLTDPNPVAAIKRFLCRVGFVLIPVSILFIKYYPDLGRSYNPWTWIPMYCGVTTFKNQLGMITLVCAMGSLWCFVRAWRNRKARLRLQHLLVHGTILGMAIWIFNIADSMTSFSCFVLAGSVLVVANQSWIVRRMALLHLMVAAVITISLIALFFDSSGTLVQTLGRDASLTGRTAIWSVVLELAKARPLLGTGFESFWMGDRLLKVWDVEKGIQEAHDGYIEVYINLGWVGLIFLTSLIVTGYRNVITVFRQNQTIGSIKLAYFVTGVIYSCTEAGFRVMSPVWIAFILGIVAVPPSILKEKPARTPLKVTTDELERFPSLVNAYEEYV
jgi:exopolysaccharide production protein ExoQ